MKAKRPRGRYWAELDERWGELAEGVRRYVGIPPDGRMLVVVSSVDGDEWHVSVAAALPDGPERATDSEVEFALTAFAMRGSTEDNSHFPARSQLRHFWLGEPEAADSVAPESDAPESPPEPESSESHG